MLHFTRASTPRGTGLLLHARHLLKCPAELGPCHRNNPAPPASLCVWLLAVQSVLVREEDQKTLLVCLLGCQARTGSICAYVYIHVYTHIYTRTQIDK